MAVLCLPFKKSNDFLTLIHDFCDFYSLLGLLQKPGESFLNISGTRTIKIDDGFHRTEDNHLSSCQSITSEVTKSHPKGDGNTQFSIH